MVFLCIAAVMSMGALTTANADPDLTIDEAQERVDELYEKAAKATERYHLAGDELTEVERRVAKIEEKVQRQEKTVASLIEELGGFAAAAYRNGTFDPSLQALLSEDPDAYLTRASVLDSYSTQQASQLEAVAAARNKLAQDTILAEEELARLNAIENQMAEEAEEIEQLLDDAENVLANLEEEERQRLLEAEREAAAEQASRASEREEEAAAPSDVPASGKGQIAVDFALAQLGEPYVWSAEGPDSWDCSGLTLKAWEAAGVSLPRSSGAQYGVGTPVSWDNKAPGDLLFFYSPISHVGIYLGNGEMIHAPRPGKTVEIVSLDGHYASNFAGARRPG
jgi:cell wall-associated NlpC family hydrolase